MRITLPSELARCAVALFILACAAGCGGHSAPPRTGVVSIRVAWPETRSQNEGRVIPAASNSIKLEMVPLELHQNILPPPAPILIARPNARADFVDALFGDWQLKATAYPNLNGTGTAQAKAEKQITVVAGETTNEGITLSSTITTVQVSPSTVSVQVGQSVQLTATAQDAQGNIVLVRPDNPYLWEIVSGAQYASVDANGLLTGLAQGTATVRATERESGVSDQATVAATGGRIAFSSNRDGNYEIYVMNSDGSNQTRLTNNPAEDWEPSWSPDQSQIAFYSYRDGNYEIYVMNSDGSNPTRLTNNPAWDLQPRWSPDGSKIAFTSSRDDNQEIYVMNSDGSNPTRLTYNPAVIPNPIPGVEVLVSYWDEGPSWSPDGSKIAFASTRDFTGELYTFTYEIYLMNSDGSGQTRLTYNAGFNVFRGISWSPDGSKIAFWSARDYDAEIYVMNSDGSNQTRLTNSPGDDNYPSWSPDGSKIAFSSDRDGNREIYVMNSDGTNPTRLTNNPAADWAPSWSPF